MKLFTIITCAVGALAAPALEKRQSTANDFIRGGCKGVVMVYARASTEAGNVGTLGPILSRGLSSAYRGDFAMQGVEYPADLASNALPRGTGQRSIDTMKDLVTRVATQCPNAKIAVGGYSQGTAVCAGAMEDLPANIRARVGAAVVFGYTRNQQNRGGIPGLPSNKVKVYCAIGDLVCSGTLIVGLPHFTYSDDASDAVRFITRTLG